MMGRRSAVLRAHSLVFLALACLRGNTLAFPPLIFSLGHHSASALPIYGAATLPLHPALELGTEWGYGKGRKWEERPWALMQGLELASFRNPFHGTGILATTKGMVRGNTHWGLFTGFSLDAGYLHLFHPRQTFSAKGDGTFERSSDWGVPSVLLGPGLHIGYRAAPWNSMRIFPLLEYTYRIQYPYNDLIPIFPHNVLQLGFSVSFGEVAGGGGDG